MENVFILRNSYLKKQNVSVCALEALFTKNDKMLLLDAWLFFCSKPNIYLRIYCTDVLQLRVIQVQCTFVSL